MREYEVGRLGRALEQDSREGDEIER
jgi:hypothetical protein